MTRKMQKRALPPALLSLALTRQGQGKCSMSAQKTKGNYQQNSGRHQTLWSFCNLVCALEPQFSFAWNSGYERCRRALARNIHAMADSLKREREYKSVYGLFVCFHHIDFTFHRISPSSTRRNYTEAQTNANGKWNNKVHTCCCRHSVMQLNLSESTNIFGMQNVFGSVRIVVIFRRFFPLSFGLSSLRHIFAEQTCKKPFQSMSVVCAIAHRKCSRLYTPMTLSASRDMY